MAASPSGSSWRGNRVALLFACFAVLCAIALLVSGAKPVHPMDQTVAWYALALLMAGVFPLSAMAFGWLEVPRIIEQLNYDSMMLGTGRIATRGPNPTASRWNQSSYVVHYSLAVLATLLGLSLFLRKPDEFVGANALQAMRFGFLGAYVYCLNLVYRRYTTLDLQPHVYLCCAVGLIAGVAFNYVAFEMISDMSKASVTVPVASAPATPAPATPAPATPSPATPSPATPAATTPAATTPAAKAPAPTTPASTTPASATPSPTSAPVNPATASAAPEFTGIGAGLAGILAFSLGYFPNLAICWFGRLARTSTRESLRRSDALPLSLIDGISELHESRLRDEGIDNVHNLATANIPDLVVKTPFTAQQIVQWIDEAVLCLYLDPGELDVFRRAHVRSISDFWELWEKLSVRYEVGADKKVHSLPVVEGDAELKNLRKNTAQQLQTTEERLDALYRATEHGPNMDSVRTYWLNVENVAKRAREGLVRQVCGRVGSALRYSMREGGVVNSGDLLKKIVLSLLFETSEAKSCDTVTADSLCGEAFLNKYLDNIVGSRRLYEQCIEQFPEDPAAFNDLAWMYLDTLQDRSLYDTALKYAEKAVELAKAANLNDKLTGYLDTLALANIRLKRPEKAVELLKEATETWRSAIGGNQPRLLETMTSAAEEFSAQGKMDQAKALLQDVVCAGYADPATVDRAKQILQTIQPVSPHVEEAALGATKG